MVRETPSRIGYTQALAVLRDASGILLLGSRERHYTASKLYPALMARRPLLALFHEASTVVDVLRRAGRAPSVRVVTYSEADPAVAPPVEAVYRALRDLIAEPVYDAAAIDLSAVADVSARAVAHQLAEVMDLISGN